MSLFQLKVVALASVGFYVYEYVSTGQRVDSQYRGTASALRRVLAVLAMSTAVRALHWASYL